MKIICVVPPLNFQVNEFGHGYQPPLGLLSVAGPLVDAGFEVELLDADAGHRSIAQVIDYLTHSGADVVLVGHSGSMVANPCCLELIGGIKNALPNIVTLYGGVYATYAYREIMSDQPAVDFIVRGEGEATVLALLTALRDGVQDFGCIEGVVWRAGKEVVVNRLRKPIQHLDQFRVAWELADWPLYRSRHFSGYSATLQFSRGCPHSCTYCGQWAFWRRWRCRDVERFADEVKYLHDQYAVDTIWIADENWAYDQELLIRLLKAIIARDVKVNIFCAMCAEDILRDADHLDLYRQAGIFCVMMGVESLNDSVVARIGKHNPLATTASALNLLRKHGILSVLNIIYGLRDETWGTLVQTLRDLLTLSPDFYNALHLTPLSWTPEGRSIDSTRIIQPDQSKWDFRQPVIQPAHFSPRGLALAVKLSEALFYLRPGWLIREMKKSPIFRRAFPRLVSVYLNELFALIRTTFARAEELSKTPKRLAPLIPGTIKPVEALSQD